MARFRSLSLAALFAIGCDAGEKPRTGAGAKRVEETKHAVEEAAGNAVRDAMHAKAALDAVMKELDQLDVELAAAVQAVADAKNDTERATASSQLHVLEQRKPEIRQRAAAARAAATLAARNVGPPPTNECSQNPLATDCS